jgi:Fe2+ transport system protein FeoA
MKTLSQLPLGARGVVVAVTGPPELRRRLLELGLVPGTPVEAIRRAPLGDPLEITLRGYALSLRANEAALVELAS